MENRDAILPLVKEKCAKSTIRWQLLDGIICQESKYDRFAVRYEPKHTEIQAPEKFARFNKTSVETEIRLQMCSWSLCQIMGSVARRLCYGRPLPQLCEIDVNLSLALELLESLKVRYTCEENILCAYNHGSVRKKADGTFVVQDYVDSVKRFMALNAGQ